ncbi:MAG TPA: sensor domain-containing diguanylate cyclase [Burkholderiales bacterium]|nr:sensor domain-containing diguanylate cyclase [Burkholderiales bacterium]
MNTVQNGVSLFAGDRHEGEITCHSEAGRLNAVKRYGILDTPPDAVLDRVTALAARLFQAPIALISIVDSDRIWFKSRHGLELPQVGRDAGLCASAILQYLPWIVTDARTDPRTRANPLVTGAHGLRFYAAAPLTTTDGYNIGTLCIADRHPRAFDVVQAGILQDLAFLVMHELDLRLAIQRMPSTEQALMERMQTEKHWAEYIARHDALTGLGNREKFEEDLSAELSGIARHGGELCVMLADVHHFRHISDRYGYSVGNEVLVRFGEFLRTRVRAIDRVARVDGKAFAVLMPHTGLSEAIATAERLDATLEDRRLGPLASLVVSFGVANLERGESSESLLHRAYDALSRAKRSRRNRIAAADHGAVVLSFPNR